MLTLLLAHIIITVSCLWTGYLFYRFILKSKEEKPVIFYAITGLITFTLISQLAALFIPVGFYFTAILLLLLILSAILLKKQSVVFFRQLLNELNSLPYYAKTLLAVLWLVILLINAGPVMMDDTESYHIQLIKWIQEYGSVPGIANLHERYGFNSSWFCSIAFFSSAPADLNLFTAINGVISLWFSFYLIKSATRFVTENNSRAAAALIAVLILSLVIWPMIRSNSATTNYDFITTVLVFILFTESFLKKQKENSFSFSAEWIIWPVYLFTIRIINFPLLLLSIFALYYIIKNGNWKKCLSPVIYCLFLVVPLLVRNVILSGYLFYPSPYFDFFNVDWKADPLMMEKLLEFIKYYSRVSTTFFDIEQTKALGSGWISSWFQHLFLHDKLILIPGIAGLLAAIVIAFKNKTGTSVPSRFFLFTLICFIISWFIISPDPRFIYGSLLAGTFTLVYYFLHFFKKEFPEKIIPYLFIVIFFAAGVYTVKKIVQQPAVVNWLAPAALPRPPVTEINLDGITFRIPEKINGNWNARCYGTPLPCLYLIDPRLKARGKKIKDGFRLEK